MSERIEKLIRDYPKLKRQQKCLYYQLADFHGISEQETIDTMYFSQPEGERVQTSGTSNKTANIALISESVWDGSMMSGMNISKRNIWN